MKSTKESRYQDRLRSYATPLVKERFSKQMKHAPTGLLMFDEKPGSSKAHFCSEGPAIIERMTEEQMNYLTDSLGDPTQTHYDGSYVIGMTYDFYNLERHLRAKIMVEGE